MSTLSYRDPHASLEERVEHLLSLMTLDEKLAKDLQGSAGNKKLVVVDLAHKLPQKLKLKFEDHDEGDKDKKHDWVQTGEMIKVGMAWRLIDGPSITDNEAPSDSNNGNNPALVKLFDVLSSEK